RRFRRPRAGRDRKTFLQQRDELFFAHPLTPTCQRRAVEGRLVLKKLLAAKELIIGVLEPALAQNLVGEIVHVLQDREPGHEPRRERGPAWAVGINGAEVLLQKTPVNRRGQLRQRMLHVDDLIEPRPKQIVLPAVPTLFRPHRESPNRPVPDERITTRAQDQFARKPARKRPNLAKTKPSTKTNIALYQKLICSSRTTACLDSQSHGRVASFETAAACALSGAANPRALGSFPAKKQ